MPQSVVTPAYAQAPVAAAPSLAMGGPVAPPAASADLTPLITSLQALATALQGLVTLLAQGTAGATAGAALAGAPPASASQVSGGGPGACPCHAPAGAVDAAVGAMGAPLPPAIDTPDERRDGVPASSRRTQPAASQASSRSRATAPVQEPSLPRENPRSVAEAIEWAKREAKSPSKSWERLCLSFVAHAYGWSASGVPYAIDHFSAVPTSMQHRGDRNPPPGSLVFWKTSGRAGHVALYLGDGMVASNDIREKGKISIVPMDEIDRRWGATYVGWTPPYFPKGVR